MSALAFELPEIAQHPGDFALVAKRTHIFKCPLEQIYGMVTMTLRAR